jgi:hypothetical protein
VRCGKVESGAAEDRNGNGAYCPQVIIPLDMGFHQRFDLFGISHSDHSFVLPCWLKLPVMPAQIVNCFVHGARRTQITAGLYHHPLSPVVINKSRQNQTGSAKTGGSAKKGGSQASDLQTAKRRHPSMAERHASIVKNDLAHD